MPRVLRQLLPTVFLAMTTANSLMGCMVMCERSEKSEVGRG